MFTFPPWKIWAGLYWRNKWFPRGVSAQHNIGFLAVTHTGISGNTLLVYAREIINYIVTIFPHEVTSNSNRNISKFIFFYSSLFRFFDQLGVREFLENFRKVVFAMAFSAVPWRTFLHLLSSQFNNFRFKWCFLVSTVIELEPISIELPHLCLNTPEDSIIAIFIPRISMNAVEIRARVFSASCWYIWKKKL